MSRPSVTVGTVRVAKDRLGLDIQVDDYVLFPHNGAHYGQPDSVEVGRVIHIYKDSISLIHVYGKDAPIVFLAKQVVVIADEWLPEQFRR